MREPSVEDENRRLLRARDAMDRDFARTLNVPAMDDNTAAQARELLTQGAVGGWLCITTPDAQRTYETLRDRGVDITDEPSPKPYGLDFGIRDPFGNMIRIGQLFDAVPQ